MELKVTVETGELLRLVDERIRALHDAQVDGWTDAPRRGEGVYAIRHNYLGTIVYSNIVEITPHGSLTTDHEWCTCCDGFSFHFIGKAP